ncbi:MAG TPA: hypothetical protein DD400_05650, partial [Rhodospirillaceae bacterium]|nr:hypothetical protein [Rhodospirillaceae bacterium]
KGIKAYSQHLAENFEEEMRVFVITAKKTPNIDPKLLRLFEKTIEETAKKIKATGNILPNFLGEPEKENNILF